MQNKRDEKTVDLSVILPVWNEEENVEKLVDELMEVLPGLGVSFEIITVNTPGRDDSWSVLEKLSEKYEQFYAVNAVYQHTRGYQKGYQYMLGFKLSKGERVIQMDSDYQDDPADIETFLKKLDEGFDLVVGWKQDRKDPFFYKLTSKMQNILTRLVTRVDVHDKNCGFKAYERVAVDAVNLYGMNYRDIPMQLSAKGFKVAEVPINNRKRQGGKSNFNFVNRLIGGTLDFSAALLQSIMLDKPFRFWGGIGGVSLLGGIGLYLLIFVWLIWTGGALSIQWWTMWWFMTCGLMIIVGVILIGIGAVAEYLRSMRGFSVSEYGVLEDPKGVVKNRLP